MAMEIQTANYEGPERRKEVEVVVKKCFCHSAHEQQLNDHAREIHEAKGIHLEIGKSLAAKVPNKLFYLFVTIVIGGLVFVYTGIHKLDKNLAVVGEKMDNNRIQYIRIETEVKELQKKVQEHIIQTNKRNGRE